MVSGQGQTQPQVQPPTPQPNQLGPFIIQERLGAGGVALVYKALDQRSKRTVALKLLKEEWTAHEEIVNRFHYEAKLAKKLQHLHIVPLIDFGVVQDRPYMALAYMVGGTLAERFKQPTQISAQESVRLMRQVASALDYAHSRGVIHRDLKLENILLDERGDALLADFGLARVLGATRMTITGSLMGTPLYMAPEQIGMTDDIDHRTDLYAFGVVAYLLTTGRFPFIAENLMTIMHMHLNEQPPLPSEIKPDLPHALDSVILRMLAKEKQDRYNTADKFVEAYAKAVSESDYSTAVDLTMPKIHPAMQPANTPKQPQTADQWYQAALKANSQEEVIMCLRRALKLDPLHTQANRMLFRLEGARPITSTNKPVVKPTASFERKRIQKQVAQYQRKQRSRVVIMGLALALVILIGVLLLFVANR